MLNSQSKSWPKIYQAQVAQLQKPRPKIRITPSLYLSPGPRTFRRAGPKSPADLRLTVFFSIFWPSKTSSKISFEKMTKKVRKSRVSASQNPPKILPKRLRNRCSNKHAIFHRFLLQRASVAKAPTSILYWFLQYKMALGRFSSCCFLHGFGIQKTIQKRIKNHARATQKSISKTCCFLISIFSILASILEALGPPTWSQVGSKCLRRA